MKRTSSQLLTSLKWELIAYKFHPVPSDEQLIAYALMAVRKKRKKPRRAPSSNAITEKS